MGGGGLGVKFSFKRVFTTSVVFSGLLYIFYNMSLNTGLCRINFLFLFRIKTIYRYYCSMHYHTTAVTLWYLRIRTFSTIKNKNKKRNNSHTNSPKVGVFTRLEFGS